LNFVEKREFQWTKIYLSWVEKNMVFIYSIWVKLPIFIDQKENGTDFGKRLFMMKMV